ncbi:hypothetical protein AAC387_Pa07g1888 [Persea americana]
MITALIRFLIHLPEKTDLDFFPDLNKGPLRRTSPEKEGIGEDVFTIVGFREIKFLILQCIRNGEDIGSRIADF